MKSKLKELKNQVNEVMESKTMKYMTLGLGIIGAGGAIGLVTATKMNNNDLNEVLDSHKETLNQLIAEIKESKGE